MPEYRQSPGYGYLELSKHTRQELFERKREQIAPAEPFKQYQGAEIFELPSPSPGDFSLWSALEKRRSVRKYQEGALDLEDLSALLWAGQGITARLGNYLLRTAPSAGALYPVETYICVNHVKGLPQGLFHHNVPFSHLALLLKGEYGRELGERAMGQPMCWRAQVVFIWSAIPRRTMAKYGSRGIRYVFMDVAHICQNVLLAAEALRLGACPIGAFFDDEVNGLLGLDGQEETVIYMASVGIPK